MLLALGLADIMAGAILLAQAFRVDIPASMMLFFAAYLIIKGGIFLLNSADWGSVGDITAGILLGAAIFVSPPIYILFFFGAFLLLKGAASSLA